MVGGAFYEGLPHDRADVAIAIADDYQGHGLSTLLLGLLAKTADDCLINRSAGRHTASMMPACS